MCNSFVNLGRPNDNIEGYDIDLQKLTRIGNYMRNLKVPQANVKQRILQGTLHSPGGTTGDITQIPITVLTDTEPNGADLNSLNSRVPVRRHIRIEDLNNQSSLIAATIGLLGLAVWFY